MSIYILFKAKVIIPKIIKIENSNIMSIYILFKAKVIIRNIVKIKLALLECKTGIYK